jgi:hypothetical protein
LKIKEEFSIVADGTETMTDFYACLIIVDSAIEIVWMKLSFEKNKIDFFYENEKKQKQERIKYRHIYF